MAIGIAWFLVFRCCCCVALRSRMFDAVRWDLELLWCVFFSVSRYVGHLLLRSNGVFVRNFWLFHVGGPNLWFLVVCIFGIFGCCGANCFVMRTENLICIVKGRIKQKRAEVTENE